MEPKQLKKSISSIGAIAIVVGSVIGSGIFLKPGIVFTNAGSPNMGLMAWIFGGIITLASALTISEIGSAIPKTGGLYVYLEDLYGDVWGFLLGWVQSVISFPAGIAALAIAFATFSTFFIPMTPIQQKLLGIGVIVFLAIMNILSTKLGGFIQTASTIAKLIPIAVIIAFGLISGKVHDFSWVQINLAGAGFGAAVLGTLWAYDAWINVTNMAGELKDPARQVPRALTIGMFVIIAVYVLVNIAMLNVAPIGDIIASDKPASDIAVILLGSGGAIFITAGIMISVFGTANAHIMTGARVPFAMAERKQLPYHRTLSSIHPKFNTPTNALIVQCIIAIVYIMSGTFNTLTDLLVFVLWIFFVMGVAGIFILRKDPIKYKTSYRVPWYPVVPIIGILGGIYIIVSTVITQTTNSIIGIAITLAGIPVFYYLNRRSQN